MEQSERKIPSKGGLKGFIKGTQPLSTAFWIVGVLPAVIIFLVMLSFLNSRSLSFSDLLLYSFAIIGIHRLFAWVSIIRCRKNTLNTIWGSLAVLVVVIDILYKTVFATIYINSYYDKQDQKQELIAIVERCKTEVSTRYNIPLSEIKANNFMSYEGNTTYYGVRHNNDYFKCYVHADTIEIKTLALKKDSGKSLQEMIDERLQEKRDSLNALQ
ncbi:MAG: hypothetical protein KJN76_08380 [Eudoraea sp.]|nr:hypothetical protein [Eudoraea sp.]